MAASAVILLVALAGPSEGAADDPLARARAAIEAGQPDEVLLILDGVEGSEAAGLLAQAATATLDDGDGVLALLLCQDALRRDGRHQAGLAVCARTALSLDQPEDAAGYAARLSEHHPADPNGPMLAMRAHHVLGDHGKVVAAADAALAMQGLPRADRDEARRTRAQAAEAIRTRETSLREAQALEQRVRGGHEAALRKEARTARVQQAQASSDEIGERSGRRGSVTIYFANRCNRSCIRARQYLTSKGVAPQRREFSRNPSAQRDLTALLGRAPRGSLYIDVAGTVLSGFSPGALDNALRQKGFIN